MQRSTVFLYGVWVYTHLVPEKRTCWVLMFYWWISLCAVAPVELRSKGVSCVSIFTFPQLQLCPRHVLVAPGSRHQREFDRWTSSSKTGSRCAVSIAYDTGTEVKRRTLISNQCKYMFGPVFSPRLICCCRQIWACWHTVTPETVRPPSCIGQICSIRVCTARSLPTLSETMHRLKSPLRGSMH